MPLVTDGNIDEDLPITDLPILFWHNVVTVTRLSSDSQDESYPVTNLANPSLALKWQQDFSGSPLAMPDYITVNISGSGPINYLAIAGHNLGSTGATVALKGTGSGASPSHQDSPPEAEYITGFIPVDDSPIIFMFEEVETSMLRLRIETPGVTAASIGVLYVGKATVLAEGIQADHTPLPIATVHEVVTGESENGNFLGRIAVSQWQESAARIANMDTDWARENFLPFLEFAAEFPFFWAWSPDSYPEEVAFAWLSNDPQLIFDVDGYVAVELGMRGLAE